MLRLIIPMPTWEDYLTLAFDEIRQFGMTSIQVMRRLRGRQAELRPDVLDGQVLNAGAAQHHLEVFVGRLPARGLGGPLFDRVRERKRLLCRNFNPACRTWVSIGNPGLAAGPF
jgi:hypothetical protein